MQAGVITYKKVMTKGTISFLQSSLMSLNIRNTENKSKRAKIMTAMYNGETRLSLIIKYTGTIAKTYKGWKPLTCSFPYSKPFPSAIFFAIVRERYVSSTKVNVSIFWMGYVRITISRDNFTSNKRKMVSLVFIHH